MKAFLAWTTQSGARVAVVILFLTACYFAITSYQRGRDLARVCTLLGSHDATGQAVTAERQAIDAICLGQETDDDS